MNKNFDKFHEKEMIILKTDKAVSLETLRNELFSLGFQEIDDFFSLKRTDKLSEWQSENIASIDVYYDNNQLNLIEDKQWNRLKIKYLFATIPFSFAEKFWDVVFKISVDLNLMVEHNDKILSKDDLIMLFYEYYEDVCKVLGGEPGSKIVLINISMTYPRNK